MFCHICGNSLKEGASFCADCGAKIIKQEIMPLPAQTVNPPVKISNPPVKKNHYILVIILTSFFFFMVMSYLFYFGFTIYNNLERENEILRRADTEMYNDVRDEAYEEGYYDGYDEGYYDGYGEWQDGEDFYNY